jgi:hypothetical protein
VTAAFKAAGFTPEEQALVSSGNARRLFGLE